MSDLERRALLGDKEAQAECTAKDVILPCPCCGGRATTSDIEMGNGAPLKLPFGCGWVGCKHCKLFVNFVHGNDGKKQALAAWNTRQEPPVGRCGTCKQNHLRSGKRFCEVRGIVHDLDDFCSYYEPKEAPNA